jgi:hypothetical protein
MSPWRTVVCPRLIGGDRQNSSLDRCGDLLLLVELVRCVGVWWRSRRDEGRRDRSDLLCGLAGGYAMIHGLAHVVLHLLQVIQCNLDLCGAFALPALINSD